MYCATALSPREIVGEVLDPEMPMVTLEDLGIIRDVTEDSTTGAVTVTITPTYSGCPAMGTIRDDIVSALHRHGRSPVEVRTSLQPAWSTDWITDEGRRKLVAAGYSPPGSAPLPDAGPIPLTLIARPRVVACPLCGSAQTQLISEFGATLCKAHYRCEDCAEPFDHMKEI
ncbi:1,2-phenylacetyl-CoA epoxidase subunit PaaD [Gordonia insulae]|uniref:1,2-phenylacetyl-CoA epoxidase, subunit D n=1 Tax=Gordonia insulae TaxID=2420509 RepID=A0A3G8JN35_9ACTN|nr:1,2-phenylacetyl-CoA epoxidase subunit PaaD [Gordonia insulae]AZG46015.1 Putative 1,2-phenylacetyl-CoA epoxidase, subunit D [Gordonia insulae]